MNHIELIEKLSNNLKPVQPLKSARWRAGVFWITSLMVTSLGVLYWYFRKDEFHIPQGRSFLELVILLIAAGVSGMLAVRSVSPHSAKARVVKSSWLALGVWTGVLAVAFGGLYSVKPEEALVAAQYKTWLCPILTVSIAIPLALILFVYLSRGAVLFPRTTSLYISQAALIFGVIGLSFICPWTDPLHELLYHVLPVVVLSLFSTLIFWGAFKTIEFLMRVRFNRKIKS